MTAPSRKGKPQAILTAPQLKKLLHVYATEGSEQARALGVQFGIAPGYVRKLAHRHGVKVKRARGPRWHPEFPRDLDPRWERAKAIGMVVI